jgi:hypothetical protein
MALDTHVSVSDRSQPWCLRCARWLSLIGLALVGSAPAAAAPQAAALKTVTYRGVSVAVPRSWPVYRLSAQPTTCVRFNRHAVYLGRPGVDQHCPVAAVGRTAALLIQPTAAAAVGLRGTGVGQWTSRRYGVTVTATWQSDWAVIATALHPSHLLRLAAMRRRSAVPPAVTVRPDFRAHTVSASAPATPGAVFQGKGFDACATPSEATMSAWGASSPYGAIGVYIGGVNMACAQPNLTASWVSTESAAGWHLAPIYVGEQAPTNSCGCASITPAQASAEGTAAATDAAYDASTVGIGSGNPIYFDMEGYSRTSANSTPVLAFLEAWTEQLHADGYLSGVYSSDASGIADLAAELGTSYVEPDDIWIAAWNGQANTEDSTIPTTAWASNQRLHQYAGGNEETYGGVEIDVDNDYLDGATAAYGGGAAVPAVATTIPIASAAPTITGVPVVGQTLTELHAAWSGTPSGYAEQWYRCTPHTTTCTAIAGATAMTYTLTPADAGHSMVVGEVAVNADGASAAVNSAGTPTVVQTPAGYWSFTATGAVYNSEYQLLWGSPATYGLRDFVGMAATPGRRGYWLVTRHATVYAFGNAKARPAIRVAHPVAGIVRDADAGYWLYTTQGNVYASRGASFDGSPARHRGLHVAGMAAAPDGDGYWLVTRTGMVFTFGHVKVHTDFRVAHPVKGIVAARNQDFWLYTADGNIYPSSGAPFYGSPVRDHVTDIAAMLATPDGRGYWLITTTGHVYAYGDARTYPDPTPTGGVIVGLAG